MIFKPRRKFYFILIVCTLLWNQQASILNQKISVENSYRDKVVSVISRLLGQNNFIADGSGSKADYAFAEGSGNRIA